MQEVMFCLLLLFEFGGWAMGQNKFDICSNLKKGSLSYECRPHDVNRLCGTSVWKKVCQTMY